jgi:nitrate/nitrite transport system permease protein
LVLFKILVPALTLKEIEMFVQLNLSAIALAGVAAWKRVKPVVIRDAVLLPAAGFLGILGLWWIVASFNSDLIPTPYQALIANLDYILHPFYQRGPGDLGIGWLLLASLRRVLVGFFMGAAVAIPVGFLIGMSKTGNDGAQSADSNLQTRVPASLAADSSINF